MERLKRFLHKFLFPGAAVVLLSVPVAAALLVYVFLYEQEYSPISYAAYAISAYSLSIACAYIIKMPKSGFRAALHKHPYIHRYLTDIPFRAHVSLYTSLGINLLFAAMKLYYGLRCRSVWFGTLAVYYILLAVMRFLLLRHVNRNSIGQNLTEEWKHYRWCGVILLLMNTALLGVVILILTEKQGYSYEGYLIYVVAMYAFYSIISAARDVIKYRKYSSPVLSAAKAIKLATALVSMLSLETAMLAQFGEADGERFRLIMTGLTGCAVCLLVLAMAVIMLCRAAGQLKSLQHSVGMEEFP
ncbi:MAG: hypothetical protein ACI3W7_01660 [Oscillospiraceae bacterium]